MTYAIGTTGTRAINGWRGEGEVFMSDLGPIGDPPLIESLENMPDLVLVNAAAADDLPTDPELAEPMSPHAFDSPARFYVEWSDARDELFLHALIDGADVRYKMHPFHWADLGVKKAMRTFIAQRV